MANTQPNKQDSKSNQSPAPAAEQKPAAEAKPAITQVAVRELKRPAKLEHNKQWNPDQEDAMGTVIRYIYLVFPEHKDAEGKKVAERKVPVWTDRKTAMVGDPPIRSVPPHLEEWARLLVANFYSGGNTIKGRGYATAIAINSPAFYEDTLKPLFERNCFIEASSGKKGQRLFASLQSLYQLGVLHAAALTETAKRYPEDEQVQEETAAAEPPPVAVAFSL